MSTEGPDVRYRFGRFELQPGERRLLEGGSPVPLRPHAFDLLVALVEHASCLVTKDELLQRVWGNVVVEENTLQAHVSALRKVLGTETITTISGRGYRFVEAVTAWHPTLETAAAPKSNLPHALTKFIGRDNEIAELERLLRTTRLLTLTGAGGCGKTRLALELAGRVLPVFDDGVWVVDLAALTDPALLPQTVGNVLGIREQASTKLMDSIVQHVAPRHLMLVLDNAEHLLDACAHFGEALLVRCARLAILVTSRERMGVMGELAYRIPSLSMPDEEEHATAESILAYESARLFIDRARLQQPRFVVTEQTAPALASICRRLDGIALALELAVPRLRVLSLDELRDGLDDRFQLLTEGSRTALPRHRTLRSLIDWSHDMLSDAEKVLLKRASVFAGGWTLEAAEHVCSGDGLESGRFLDVLTSLAEKSLVAVESHDGAMRFGLLETVREYAYHRLQESDDDARVRARHLEYFIGIADQARRHEMAADAATWLHCIAKERDNFRAALRWSCRSGGAVGERALRLAGLLAWFWVSQGHFTEGREWLSAALSAGQGAADDDTLARGLRAIGALALMQGDVRAAKSAHERALEIETARGDRRQIGITLYNLACLVSLQEDYGKASTLFEQALSIHRELGDRAMTALCVGNLGMVVSDRAVARAHINEALALWRELGDWRASYALCGLGRLTYAEGDHRSAQGLLQESLELARNSVSYQAVAWTLSVLGAVAYEQGDCYRAAQLLTEAVTIQHELGDLSNLANSFEACAAVALAASGPVAAASIWGHAEALRERMGSPTPTERYGRRELSTALFAAHPLHDRLIAGARAALADDRAFDNAWNDGRAMSWQQATRYAIDCMKFALTPSIAKHLGESAA